LETSLGKSLPPEGVWAESWEVVDHRADQSVVEFGALAGATLHELVARRGSELLGRHDPQPRFPLLLKFLDAAKTLSVQVHPDEAAAARLASPDGGKTEACVVVESLPGSLIYAGLKPGVDRRALAAAIGQRRCQDCLHSFAAAAGDCVFLPAGTVHALGAGLLVVEIQQSSDATFRLFDWNHLGPDEQPRPLHVEQALEVIDFLRGPVSPVCPKPTARPEVARLVECDKFSWDRWEINSPVDLGGDERFHIIAVLAGGVRIENDPAGRPVPRGGTALLPAAAGRLRFEPEGQAVLLDAYLP
jgi:mannose-6-phosphate isomerase